MRTAPEPSPYTYTGTALNVDSIDFIVVERCNIEGFNYGIWINNSTGGFAEVNMFRDLWVSDCTNCVRMEQVGPMNSFHATSFSQVAGNCYQLRATPQIYLNLVSGFWYNFTLGFHIWTVDGAVAINVGADAYNGFGSVQIEAQNTPGLPGTPFARFTGVEQGRLQWTGSLDLNGILQDDTVPYTGVPSISCNNYFSHGPLVHFPPDFSIRPLTTSNSKINPDGAFPVAFDILGNNVACQGLATYGYGRNGLYLVNVPFGQGIEQANLGMFLSSSGEGILAVGGDFKIQLYGQPNDQLILQSSGRHTGRMGKYYSDGLFDPNQIIHVACGDGRAETAAHVMLRIVGLGTHPSDFRALYVINPRGDAALGPGTVSLITILRFDGVLYPTAPTVDYFGNLTFTTGPWDAEYSYSVSVVGVGYY